MAAIIKYDRIPIAVKPLARIRMLEKVAAIEIAKAVLIRREVAGNPVKDDPDTPLVELVD